MSQLNYHVDVYDTKGEKHTFGPGDDVPAWARKSITNPSAWADGGESTEADGADDVQPYAKWKKADLEKEVESRNEGRDDDDLIVVGGTGKVADLAAALEADDDAQAE